MISLQNLFKKKEKPKPKNNKTSSYKRSDNNVAVRKGEIGEYKVDIQLSQLSNEYKYLNDMMIKNPKSSTGYSQIDHVIITPYGIFVIETKNYQGTIYGGKNRKSWLINGKFKMNNPLIQNYGHIQALKMHVDEQYHQHFISLVSFTKRCTLKIDQTIRDISSNEMVIYDLFLTETINRKIAISKLKNKESLLTKEDIVKLYTIFSKLTITDPKVREEHNRSINESQQNGKNPSSDAKCVVCGKIVSNKVEKYCLSNKRFGGRIYCYEHQKT